MFTSGFNSAVGPIGIDFGTSGIKMLQLRLHGGRPRVYAAGCVESPLERHSDAESISDAVRQCLTANRFSGKRCIVSLARSDVRVQSVRMPQLPAAELKQTVTWEAAERFQLDRDAIESDYLRLGEVARGSDARDELLIMAAERSLVQRRLEPLVMLGLQPQSIDYQTTALVRFHSMKCRRESDRMHVRAFLDIGAGGSTFVVTRGDQVALCKPIDIGGRQLDAAVAAHLGLDAAVAHDLRAKRLLAHIDAMASGREADDDSRDRASFEAVRALLGQICKEVGLCMRYYGVTFRGQPPQCVVISGGDALEPHLDQMLARACNAQVVFDDEASSVGEALEAVRFAAGRSTRPAQCWSVAAGLSLRGLPLKGDIERRTRWFVRKEAA